MTSKILAACLSTLVAAASAGSVSAQDTVHLINGKVVKDVRVTDYDIRSLRYKNGSSTESTQSDQVAKIELGQFKTVYARGLSDPGLMLTLAREQKDAKNEVLAQLGFVGAAERFLDRGMDAEGVAALNELEKAYPEGGAIADVYRLKFEYYMGLGAKGISSANTVAKKYESAAIGNAWPNGFAIEAKFFQVLCSDAKPDEFQRELRSVVNRAASASVVVANRANVELAHSLRKTKQGDEARRIYERIVERDDVDDSSRGGAYLGLGLLALEESAGDKEKAKEALLKFLRVRLETREAWPGLHAEALYHSIDAARKWDGPESRYIAARCRGVLFAEFPNSEWAQLLKQR